LENKEKIVKNQRENKGEFALSGPLKKLEAV
jgi:hypothetical protein